MPHEIGLILTLAGGLAGALVLGYLTHRMGLSSIVGYLLAGILVGPHTPGFVADRTIAEQFAEVGVVLLMFGVGLQFHFRELLAVRRIAIPGAVFQSAVATALGAFVGRAFGWTWEAGVVFGLALSVASTVVLVRVLEDHRDLHTRAGHIAVGWLVVEDLFTVVVLVLLPALLPAGGGAEQGAWTALGIAIAKIALFTGCAVLVGGRAIPWLLARVADTRSRELFTLTVLVVALGVAVGAAELFGVSMALGAFLAGMIVGRSDFSSRAASEALPMRDAFAVLFFVATGMLLDPARVVAEPLLLAATLAVVVVAKPAAALAIVVFLRQPPRVAIPVSVALAQIGEFSFILAAVGRDLGVLPPEATNVLVAAAIASITLNPLLYRLTRPAEAWLARRPALWRALNTRVEPAVAAPEPGPPQDAGHRAIVVGHGPVGRIATRLLSENGIEPVVIELNPDTVRALRADGRPAVYGDASHRETLEAAGVTRAATLVLTASGLAGRDAVIRLAREMNPSIRVIARGDYVREAATLRSAGADGVFVAEAEVALAITVAILSSLGATPDQVDRERDRVRRELLDAPA